MELVTISKAKIKLSDLVERARKGEKIGITWRGKLAAVLTAAPAQATLKEIFYGERSESAAATYKTSTTEGLAPETVRAQQSVALACRRRLRLDRRRNRRRRLRHDHPSHEIRNDSAYDSPRDHRQYGPEEPHNCGIYPKVFGQPAAYSGDLRVRCGTHQSPVRKHRSHSRSAVGTKI
jgi:prevent-host-death family protein